MKIGDKKSDRGRMKMTKQEFWKMIGYVFENYDIPCADCPACGDKVCAISCEQALKSVYERLERESNEIGI